MVSDCKFIYLFTMKISVRTMKFEVLVDAFEKIYFCRGTIE
ncbi:hypothetical protein [Clostridium yunnanense]|nr:hypothetical protein [Clostridium yunnanense]